MRRAVQCFLFVVLLVIPLAVWACARNVELAIFFFVGEMLAMALVTLSFLRGYSTPVENLSAWVEALKAGRLETPAPNMTAGAPQVKMLAESLKALMASLEESRRLETEHLLRVQETTRSAIDSLPHAVAVVNPQGRLELMNRMAEGLFGLKPGMVADGSAPRWLLALVEEARRTGAAVKSEGDKSVVQVFDKGHELFFVPRAIPVTDAAGKMVGITVMLEDATELRKVEEAKSGLLAMVSHELKTPLTSIQMAIHLLLDDEKGHFSERERDLLQTAGEDADRLNELIQKLLDKGRRGE